jgi:hypothetical protein
VQALRGGGRKYQPGKITRVHIDNTFDIQYEDGETEIKVPKSLMKIDKDRLHANEEESKSEEHQ